LGSLAQDLARHSTIGVDTPPFIYLWEKHPRYSALAEALFDYLRLPHVQGITSVITLIEACVMPQRHGRSDLVETYGRALTQSKQIHLMAIDTEVANRALALRAGYDIPVPDALQLGAALVADATAFVTNDRRLASVKELAVLVLDDYST
jgi:predicted nucleic acid-binding protein